MSSSRFLYGLLFTLLICFWFVAYKYGGQTENVSAQSVFLGAVLIFLLRLSDMTLNTLRLMFTMRGHKWLAALVGFMEAAIVVVAITKVVSGPTTVWKIIGYAGGFACGIVVGMSLEDRMALGFSSLQIISKAKGEEIAAALRGVGHAATVLSGTGKDGAVCIVNCMVRRSEAKAVKALAEGVDPHVFVTGEEVRTIIRGHFRV